jgi:phenylpropionate dioxygenase-like ring-hydroxylating dioxygenase large terminal subunit
MRSRYGWKVPQEDVALTHVEAGSPMGELLRRYWQPVCLSEELKDLPRRVRILCEDLVLFRTRSGKVGCLELHCSHRGTSLEWGRVEEDGLRCCYHGWLYDTEGRVVEMPCESPEVCRRINVEHPAYPTHEFGGLVYVYMGPPERKPSFPIFDILDVGRQDAVLRGMRIWDDASIGFVRRCNWLQHYENVVDPWHLVVLHQQVGQGKFDGPLLNGHRPTVTFESTPLGVRYRLLSDLPNGNRLERYAECVIPNIFLVPSIHELGESPKSKDKCTEVSWVVPNDNEHIHALTIAVWPVNNGKLDRRWRPRTDTASTEGARLNRASPSARHGERSYEERQRRPDDMEAQEGQRAIAVHALEHLVPSDKGVALLRRRLREQLQRITAGDDPINVWRGGAESRTIETNAWNTILTATAGGPKAY